jgi:DNA-binding CsgD family transcriptional regulator
LSTAPVSSWITANVLSPRSIPARRGVRSHRPALVDVRAVDLHLERYPPPPRLLAHGSSRTGCQNLGAFAVDIRRVAAGEVVIDPELVSRLVGRRREHDTLAELTDREREVLALMAQGLTNAALAKELFVSLKTIEGYVRSVFTKLGLAPGEREHRRVLAVLQFLRKH